MLDESMRKDIDCSEVNSFNIREFVEKVTDVLYPPEVEIPVISPPIGDGGRRPQTHIDTSGCNDKDALNYNFAEFGTDCIIRVPKKNDVQIKEIQL